MSCAAHVRATQCYRGDADASEFRIASETRAFTRRTRDTHGEDANELISSARRARHARFVPHEGWEIWGWSGFRIVRARVARGCDSKGAGTI